MWSGLRPSSAVPHPLARPEGEHRHRAAGGGRCGAATLVWRVSHNSEHGQPGPLAYKIDTLVVNRKLDEAGRPTPASSGLGASPTSAGSWAWSTAARTGPTSSGRCTRTPSPPSRPRSDTRPSMGPGSRVRHDPVHRRDDRRDVARRAAGRCRLHPPARPLPEVLRLRPVAGRSITTTSRPYPPPPSRYYELLSYHVFVALKHGQPRAQMRYSEFCRHAPQTRYTGFGPMRKQMAKIHAPHLRSGYLAGVEFKATTNHDDARLGDDLHTRPEGPSGVPGVHAEGGRSPGTSS